MRLTLECRGAGLTAFVDHHELYPGVVLKGDFGMTGTVSPRLVRIVALLALRRIGGVKDGWTEASEIASLVDRTGHAEIPSPGGVAKFLERLLRQPGETPSLIQYKTRSTGPYRLSLPPHRIVIRDLDQPSEAAGPSGSDPLLVQGVLWAAAMDSAPALVSAHQLDIEAALEASDIAFEHGNLPSARAVVARAVVGMMRGEALPKKTKDALMLLARAHERLAYLDMEMGQSNAARIGATAALQLYRRVGDRTGRARILQINAHAHRQLGEQTNAVHLATMSLRASKQSRRTKPGLEQAGFLGVLGQQLTYRGRGAEAIELLTTALEIAEDAGDRRWTACWHLRLVENALSLGQLDAAERHLGRALELHSQLPRDNIPHEALVHRISAHFYLATGSLAAARFAIRKAHDIGVIHAMSHQIRAMRPLLCYLEDDG